MLATRVETSVGARNVPDWKQWRINGSVGLAVSMGQADLIPEMKPIMSYGH